LEKKEREVTGSMKEYQIEFQRVEEDKNKYEKEILIN